jgi:hypothetical protein
VDVESTASVGPDLLRESSGEKPRQEPGGERGFDGQIHAALDGLLGRSLMRGDDGRFVAGKAKTGEYADGFWRELEPVKAGIVSRVRRQLAVDDDDGRETLINLIDGYAEAHLLRKSTFMQLARRGGPVTNKGKVRGLLQAWGTFFDREMRAAERLGLERRSKAISKSPRAWLESLDDRQAEGEEEREHDDNEPGADTQTGRQEQNEQSEPTE